MLANRPQNRPVHAGDADRTRLAVQPVVERGADRQDPSAASFARLEDDHRSSRLTEQRRRPQAGEAGADNHDWRARRLRLGGQDGRRGRRERQLEKLAPAHRN